MKRLIALGLLICAVWLQPALAQPGSVPGPERRVALVIGNNDYIATTKLERAVTDARAMGAELRRVGFQVIEHSNLDRRGMNQAINELVDKVSGGGVGVLFFAGHGVQVSGTNYLLPTDIKISRAEDLADEAIDLGRVMDRLAVAKSKFALLIIDACRDNPFPRTPGRSIGAARGLTIPSAPDGLMVVYSAGVNEQALDKLDAADRDPNGLFTREFLKQIRQPGVRVDEMVRRVRASVREQAQRIGHAQNPAIYDQAQGEFYFVSPVAAAAIAPPSPPPVAAQTPSPASSGATRSDDAAFELAFWDAIKTTSAAADYEEYLRQFPNGRFAGLARARRDRLLASAIPTAEVRPAQPVGAPTGTTAVTSAQTHASTAASVPTLPLAIAPVPPVVPPSVQVASQPAVPQQTVAAPTPAPQKATSVGTALAVPVPAAQVALAAPGATVAGGAAGVGESKAPNDFTSMRGKRYFGRSNAYELEVEATTDGLKVLRFGMTANSASFRCGIFNNEIEVGQLLRIRSQQCSLSSGLGAGYNTGVYLGLSVSGEFPILQVKRATGTDPAGFEVILLLESSLRDRFDEALKASPSLTTQSFAQLQ